jgi:uncharacterized phiE125 gp8 family phage protein
MPPATDLTTLADLKLWLHVSGTGDDALLSQLITQLSIEVGARTLRDALFTAAASYTETYDGNGGAVLALRHFPIVSVSVLTVNTVNVPLSPDGVQAGFVFDAYTVKLVGYSRSTIVVPGLFVPPWMFSRGFGNIAVTYTAGYATAPPDLQFVTKMWCAHLYRQRDFIAQKSKRIETGETVSFDLGEMPEYVKCVIDRYKRVY